VEDATKVEQASSDDVEEQKRSSARCQALRGSSGPLQRCCRRMEVGRGGRKAKGNCARSLSSRQGLFMPCNLQVLRNINRTGSYHCTQSRHLHAVEQVTPLHSTPRRAPNSPLSFIELDRILVCDEGEVDVSCSASHTEKSDLIGAPDVVGIANDEGIEVEGARVVGEGLQEERELVLGYGGECMHHLSPQSWRPSSGRGTWRTRGKLSE
jgi:hypothetical protein